MPDESGRFTGTLEPLTELLTAHASLISETSEHMAESLGNGIQDMCSTLAESQCEHVDRLRENIGGLLSALQMQDVLRQQVLVLIKGLESVAKAHVPDNERPEEWYLDCLKDIESAYVMQAQHDVHADFLGLPAKQMPQAEIADDDALFF